MNFEQPANPAQSTSSVADTEKEDPRLIAAMEFALEELEAGRQLTTAEVAERFPGLGDELEKHLQGLKLLSCLTSSKEGRKSAAFELVDPVTRLTSCTLGDFRLIRMIGRGGMGIVYEAEQISLGRKVAVKVLPFAATLDKRRLQRFHNEARAASSLEHPNIVPVYAVGHEQDIHFFAMQLIAGETVADLISKLCVGVGSDLSESERHAGHETPHFTTSMIRDQREGRFEFFRKGALLVAQAADALEEAHRSGILHRDIKPSNLLVNSAGKLFVTDFGLACFLSDEALTESRSILGTAGYMSPEQSLGSRNIDARSDIYSLGATARNLLLSRVIADDSTVSADNSVIRRDSGSDFRGHVPKALVDLETIVLKALSPLPVDRYQTAAGMAEDLRRFADGWPIAARRLSPLVRLTRWIDANRVRAAVLGTSLLLMAVTVIAGLVFWSALVTRHSQDVARLLEKNERALRAAEAAEQVARVQERRAAANELKAQKVSYRANIQLGYENWERRNWYRTAEILSELNDGDAEASLRGPEWHLLNAKVSDRLTLLGRHDGAATECVLFPDGQRAATVGEDGVIRLWDVRTLEATGSIEPRLGPLHAIAVSRDGATLAVGGSPRGHEASRRAFVHLVDVASASVVRSIHEHTSTIESIRFSADGSRIASGSRYEEVTVSNLDGTHSLTLPAIRRNEAIEFSPDGESLTAPVDKKQIGIWNAQTGTGREIPCGHPRSLGEIAWFPSGTELALGFNRSPGLALMRLADEQVRWFRGADPVPREIQCLAVDPTGATVVGGDVVGRIHRWFSTAGDGSLFESGGLDPSSAAPAADVFSVHRDTITDIAVTANAQILTTVEDGSVALSDPDGPVAPLLSVPVDVTTICMGGNDVAWFGTSSGAIGRYDLVTGEASLLHEGCGTRVADLAVCDKSICIAFVDGSLKVIDFNNGKTVWASQQSPSDDKCFFVAVSRDGAFLAWTGKLSLRVWDLRRQELLFEHTLTKNGASLTFSPDSQLLACGSDKTIVLDSVSGVVQREIAGNNGVLGLAFSPDGRMLAEAGDNRKVQLVDLHTGTKQVLVGHRCSVRDVAFAPNGRTLMSVDAPSNGGEESRICFWDVESGQLFGGLKSRLPATNDALLHKYDLEVSSNFLLLGAAVGDDPPCWYSWKISSPGQSAKP